MPSHATARASGRSLASARASGHRLRAPAFSLAPARSRRPRSVAPARQRRPRPRTVPSSGASCLGVGGSGGRAGDVGGRLTACGRSRGNFPKKEEARSVGLLRIKRLANFLSCCCGSTGTASPRLCTNPSGRR
ncbi:uncharacterized protein LOC110431393 [Sorghum bicolor]|uniref:uncharacterized protein LOC110431393 n=1 Tax=Sorghum bicolor TaxID=4558 RepID=UPI000B424CDD|nr:uncharacterized protein LOC110431393 [Sorghum bicolor]|eukprot:XP_021306168.1 uncharacterized protein LOC110431393 [Sorghum bicolor]